MLKRVGACSHYNYEDAQTIPKSEVLILTIFSIIYGGDNFPLGLLAMKTAGFVTENVKMLLRGWERKRNGCSLVQGAADINLPAMGFHDGFAHAQPQTIPAGFAGP